jgi:hypothetical protein
MTRETREYASTIDVWTILIIAVAGLAPVVVVLADTKARGNSGALTIVLTTSVLVLALFVGLFRSTKYVLDDSTLTARCGPMVWQVKLSEITKAGMSWDPMSAPAFGFHRLKIEYGKAGALMITPAHRERFLEDLQERAPQVTIQS